MVLVNEINFKTNKTKIHVGVLKLVQKTNLKDSSTTSKLQQGNDIYLEIYNNKKIKNYNTRASEAIKTQNTYKNHYCINFCCKIIVMASSFVVFF